MSAGIMSLHPQPDQQQNVHDTVGTNNPTIAAHIARNQSIEMKELAARICRDYLNGPWKLVTAQNIGFKHISGGLSNLLYHISLPGTNHNSSSDNDNNDSNDEDIFNNTKKRRLSVTDRSDIMYDQQSCTIAPGVPSEVLIRIYGQMHGENALEALITESVIFTLLSERGLGPKLHGIFPGGRIEQYINARPLRNFELSDARLSCQIARKMAAVHNMEVPLHKDPSWLWKTTERWLRTCDSKLKVSSTDSKTGYGLVKKVLEQNMDNCQTLDLNAEAQWLRERLDAEQCPVVFCHNDMQEGNILLQQFPTDSNDSTDAEEHFKEPRLVLIDFEYCSYNYRSFDIANHFLEWVYDYTENEHPFYSENMQHYPNREQRLAFIQSYLEELNGIALDSKDDLTVTILKEVEVFSLASHFFWGLWAIVNADTSQIPFGYWEYAASRLTRYFELKQSLDDRQHNERPVFNLNRTYAKCTTRKFNCLDDEK